MMYFAAKLMKNIGFKIELANQHNLVCNHTRKSKIECFLNRKFSCRSFSEKVSKNFLYTFLRKKEREEIIIGTYSL